MPADSNLNISPTVSASSAPVSESDLGSELSFESIEREMQPTADRRSTTMANNAQLNGLSFHPTYSAKDRMVIFQVSNTNSRVDHWSLTFEFSVPLSTTTTHAFH
jgi:hypothetical protein